MPKASTPAAPPAVDFEAAMAELESLVERLETGDLPLDESLQAFERGVALTRSCQGALKDAEQKVEVLLKKAGAPAGQPVVEEFKEADSDEP
jgi:exodeoxyribonuclease VII small subunit